MLKHELRNLLSGTGKTKQKNLIQTISGYLAAGKAAGRKIKNKKLSKQEETELITEYINLNHPWNTYFDEANFIAEGAEQKVYLNADGISVTKVNSGIFYCNWSDYLHNLIIHNFFFPETAYSLLGFIKTNHIISAVVKQPYVIANEITDLNNIKMFMKNNGFMLKKNNDYYNESLGIIAEDLHDENVLTRDNVLFFIDTVFCLTDSF
jgi:hypothetical protein